MLECTELSRVCGEGTRITDLAKVETLLVTWEGDGDGDDTWWGVRDLVELIHEQMKNLRMLALVYRQSLCPKFERAVRGDGYCFTAYGPFSDMEMGMRRVAQWRLDMFRHIYSGWQVPIVLPVRIEKARSSGLPARSRLGW